MGKHTEWRKIAKKMRRKRKRSALARDRDEKLKKEQELREQSPTYQAWLAVQEELEAFAAVEEERLRLEDHKRWEEEDKASVIRWKEQQIKLEQIKAEKLKQEMLIREEWEREQQKLKEAEEAKRKEQEEKKRKQEELIAQIQAYIAGTVDLPVEAVISTETHPGREKCPFFSKTGACRFRDNCSRNHIRPGLSRALLFPNFYEHFGLNTLHQDEYDTDVHLEYEESETYQHFLDFYDDVLPEFEKCGHVTQFKVCNNEESHLRGNVYVEYESKRQAMKAFCSFQGRFYGGKKLAVEFTDIPSWKDAVCGLFHKQKCPKGRNCNFLHVFRDPYNSFRLRDRYQNLSQGHSFSRSPSPSRKRYSRGRENWRWSDESDSEDVQVKQRRRSRSSDRSERSERRKHSRSRRSSPKEDVRSKDYKKKRKKRSRSSSPRHGRKHKKQDKTKRTNYHYSNGPEKHVNGDRKEKNDSDSERRKKVCDNEMHYSTENKQTVSDNNISDSPVR